ncbi:hypothetical protein ABIF24_003119 [Bradyrhizobium elkanii]
MHLPARRLIVTASLESLSERPIHARPPASRTARQPHRRRRSGGTPRERGQGTGRERDRRRRQPDRRFHRWRRAAPNRHHRRWRRHDPRRPRACGRPSRHLQARRRRPAPHPHARLPRRGAALDRRGRKARHHDASCQRAACLVVVGRRRREVRGHAGRARPGHPRRGQRALLCHAGAAEVPQDRPHRGGGDPRGGASPRHGAPGHRLHAGWRRARAGHLGRGAARRRRPADPARRYPRRGFSRQCDRGARRARGRRGRGLCRRAVANPRQCARAISVRQRPPGARQADPRRGARGLFGLPAARPPSCRGAVRDLRPARGRCQCASGQDRGAFPQFRAWCAR